MTDAILNQVHTAIPEIPFSVVSQGAEALVLSTKVHPYLENTTNSTYIVKYRPRKPYRHPKIDTAITKARTIGEAKFMVRLSKAGIPAPTLVLLDPINGVIWMEHIGDILSGGEVSSLKNYLWDLEKTGGECDGAEARHMCKATGSVVGRLHMNDMIHGDLTTSNIILDRGRAVLIDFGLSSYSNLAEDKAVDLYVMERAVLSTHSDYAEKYTQWLLEGYQEAHATGKSKYKDTMKKLEEVRLRGRKRSMLG